MAHSNLDESASEFNSIHVLQPPTTFSFPFEPYDIQKQFMEQMYRVLEDGKIGLFESPTGTGKSLSIICSCLRWLMDHQERENRRVKALLAGDVSALLSGDGSQNPSDPSVPDWFVQYDQQKKLKDEIYRLERVSKKKEQRERRIKDLKEKFGTSLIKKSHHAHDTKHTTLESIQYQFENPQTDLEHDDIILNEYHSDNDITSDSSSDSDSDSDTEETLKIFYTSRTHSQLSQFLHEVLKTPYKDMVSVIPLGSRQTYCLNKSVMRLQWQNLINDRCLELQKNKKKSAVSSSNNGSLKQKRPKGTASDGCPYYKPVSMETLRDLALGKIQDIEQLSSLGKELSACPYYSTRHAIQYAQLVLLPYQSLFHRGTRESLGIKLKGNIVIIDEAHNLIDTISSIHSVEITLSHIKKALSQLIQYKERYQARLKAKNIVYIDQIVYILDSFKRILQETIVNPQTHTEQCQLFGLTEFMLKFKIDNINMFKVLNYCKKSQISKKLNGFVERYLTEDIIPTRDDVKCGGAYSDGLVLKSPLMLIEQFIQSLTTPDKDCRIAVKRMGFDSQSSLKYLLLNPSIHFIDVVNETRAIILAGGTMQPLSQFKTQLFPSVVSSSDLIEFSCGHVIPPNHLLPVVMTCGPSSKMFDFTYNNRQNPALIDELGQCLYNLCSIVPGGVVCFFPSYDYEKVVYKKWEESGLLDRLLKKKQIFREPKMVSQVQMILSRYAESIRNSDTITKTNTATETTLSNEVSTTTTTTTGGVLLCVVGGKLSEGINFSDDLGRCVVMVGLPYPNKKSPELAEKLAYLDATLPRDPTSGRLPSQLHYENLCMKGVNQSIGRAIRHINDYATIVLLDNRYSNKAIYSMLPQWISSNLLISNSFGSGFGAIRKFFYSKRK